MKIYTVTTLFLFILFNAILPCHAQVKNVFIREDFNDLNDWRPLHFPKIKKHTKYSIAKEGNIHVLQAESSASASGIVFNKEFNVYQYPKARWKWKISNVYKRGNAKNKSGDDYPIRVYIIFKYDPDSSSFTKMVKYAITKKIYGEYPPDSTLNYIWANRKHKERALTNTYAKESQMVILRSGAQHAGVWIEQEVNILRDYKRIFGADPPPVASIAIMNDSDNTGERSVSYIDFIEVYR
jgi:hypothetical protein